MHTLKGKLSGILRVQEVVGLVERNHIEWTDLPQYPNHSVADLLNG